MSRRKVLVIGYDGLMFELVEKFVAEGIMPNFKKLIESGMFTKALSSPPVDTPTNWTSLGTGAWTGTHGNNTFCVHWPGEPFEKFHDSRLNIFPRLTNIFHLPEGQEPLNVTCQAEYIWQSARHSGFKTLLVNWPGGWPPNMADNLVTVDGAGPYCSGLARLNNKHLFASEDIPGAKGRIPLTLRPAENWKGMPRSKSPALETALMISGEGNAINLHGQWVARSPQGAILDIGQIYYALIIDSRGKGYDKVILTNFQTGKDARQPVAVLKRGQWSDWLTHRIRTVRRVRKMSFMAFNDHDVALDLNPIFRLRLVELSRDGKRIALLRTSMFNLKGWAYPEPIARELVEHLFKTAQKAGKEGELGTDGTTGEIHPATPVFQVRESVPDQAVGLAIMSEYLGKKCDWDLMMVQLHAPDGIFHGLLNKVCPGAALYNPAEEADAWNRLRAEHRCFDEMLGRILKSCADQNTVVAVVSDHASLPTTKMVWLPHFFEKAGLTTYVYDQKKNAMVVNWAKTKAFVGNFPLGQNVWVNLKGRDPHGIVSPGEEFERVRDQCIAILRSVCDPENGKPVLSCVLRKEDAQMFGQWGDRVGDIVFYYEPPYFDHMDAFGGGPIKAEIWPIPPFLPVTKEFGMRGSHHHCLPTATYGGFSVSGILILSGPGVKKGYRRLPSVWTPDVVPTLCALSGLPLPRQAEGKIVADALK
jgi:hypothetical protein